MANQQNRPAWFRLSSIAGRAPAPARPPVPAAAPLRPPAPVPAIVRLSIPTRPIAPPPTLTQEPAPPPPPSQSQVAPPPPAAPPVSSTPSPRPSPPSAPQPSPPVSTRASPPPAAAATQPSPPLSTRASPPPAATQPSPPKALASARPSPPPSSAYAAAPPPPPPPALAAKHPLPNSPVQKETLPTSTDAPAAPSPPKTKNTATGTPSPTMLTSPKQAETANATAATPVPSPKVVKPLERTPAQSPKLKPAAAHSLSPFTLPPAQVNHDGEPDTKIDQKNVLVQQSIDKPMNKHRGHNHPIPSNGRREPTSKDKGLMNKKVYDSEMGMGVRMITLAGENKGAVMELNPSHKKSYLAGNLQSLQKHHGIKSGGANGDQSSSASEKDEGNSRSNKDKMSRSITMQSPMKANLNSNVQGLNNSILFNCSFRNNDPGIHLTLTRKANGGRTSAMDK